MKIDYFDYVRYLPYVPVFIGLTLLFRNLKSKMTKYDDYKLAEGGAFAPMISYIGAFGGVCIATMGSLIGSSESMWFDLFVFAFQGLIAVFITLIAQNVIDMVVLPHIENDTHLEKDNRAVAVVEACTYLGIGAIMAGSFSGSDPSFWNGTLSTVVFSAAGILTVCLIYKIYDMLTHDIDGPISNGSMPTALNVGSFMLGTGILLGFSINGDTLGWKDDLLVYLQGAVMAGVMTAVISVVTHWLFLSSGKSSQHALMRFASTIAFSIMGGLLIVN
jgi:uncharacterized membrane protein YjfL (UPF0719 family)